MAAENTKNIEWLRQKCQIGDYESDWRSDSTHVTTEIFNDGDVCVYAEIQYISNTAIIDANYRKIGCYGNQVEGSGVPLDVSEFGPTRIVINGNTASICNQKYKTIKIKDGGRAYNVKTKEIEFATKEQLENFITVFF